MMKSATHPIVVCKKIHDTVFTKDEEKIRETKTVQYFLPSFQFKSIIKFLEILLLILIVAAIIAGKKEEVAPIMNFILEQLP